MRERNGLVAFGIMMLLSICLLSRDTQNETITVTAVGEAAGSDLAAKEKSRENALRAAVEKGFGVYVDSSTLVENAALIHDDIVAETRGFVKYYDILDQKVQDEIFVTRIRAEVSMDKIWESEPLKLLLKRMGAPRFVIIADEYHEGKQAHGSYAREVVTEQLVARGFHLVYAPNSRKLSRGQIKNALSNNRMAVEIGKKANAEIIVLVNSSGAFFRRVTAYGTTFDIFRGNCEIRAIQVGSRKIIASSVKDRQSGSVKEVIPAAGEDNAEDIVKQLLAAWSNYLNMGRTIDLVINHISVSELMRIIEEIKALEGVAGVTQRNYSAKSARLEIKSKHKAMYLAESIENLHGFKLEVSDFSAYKITVRKK